MSGGGIIKVDISGGSATVFSDPIIDNINIIASDIFQEYNFPSGVKSFELKSRFGAHFKLKYDAISDDFISVKGFYSMKNIDPTTVITLYISCTYVSEIIEVVSWF